MSEFKSVTLVGHDAAKTLGDLRSRITEALKVEGVSLDTPISSWYDRIYLCDTYGIQVGTPIPEMTVDELLILAQRADDENAPRALQEIATRAKAAEVDEHGMTEADHLAAEGKD